jgi:uncharacterized protein (DUF4415 family)
LAHRRAMGMAAMMNQMKERGRVIRIKTNKRQQVRVRIDCDEND